MSEQKSNADAIRCFRERVQHLSPDNASGYSLSVMHCHMSLPSTVVFEQPARYHLKNKGIMLYPTAGVSGLHTGLIVFVDSEENEVPVQIIEECDKYHSKLVAFSSRNDNYLGYISNNNLVCNENTQEGVTH